MSDTYKRCISMINYYADKMKNYEPAFQSCRTDTVYRILKSRILCKKLNNIFSRDFFLSKHSHILHDMVFL